MAYSAGNLTESEVRGEPAFQAIMNEFTNEFVAELHKNAVESLGVGVAGQWGGIGVSEDAIQIMTGQKKSGDTLYGVQRRLDDGTLADGKVKPKNQPLPPAEDWLGGNRPAFDADAWVASGKR
ncbi:MAG: hypothetical protein LBF97_00280 [Elusimicrobiota bacterium]|jgi:hypothetical protein|nr:hypothetical protein [Elusimicrobiota bacterium]